MCFLTVLTIGGLLFLQENLGTSNKLTEILKCKSNLQLAFDCLLQQDKFCVVSSGTQSAEFKVVQFPLWCRHQRGRVEFLYNRGFHNTEVSARRCLTEILEGYEKNKLQVLLS